MGANCYSFLEVAEQIGEVAAGRQRKRANLEPHFLEAIAGLLGCPVIMMVALRRGAHRYEAFAELLSDPANDAVVARCDREAHVQEVISTYVARLERFCKADPYQWFNFYDFWREQVR